MCACDQMKMGFSSNPSRNSTVGKNEEDSERDGETSERIGV